MRIATSTIQSMVQNTTGNAYKNYSDLIQKIASNKNFTKVSEDVMGATKVLKLNDNIAKMQEYQSNIKAAMNEMDVAYDVLSEVNDELNTITALVMDAANATTSPDSARAIATEISERVGTISDKMNTKYLDSYIFSGSYTQKQAYVMGPDGAYVYQGSSPEGGDRNLTISEGVTFAYNFTGEEIFCGADGLGNTKEFFSEMNELNEILTTEPLDYNKIREKLNIIRSTQDNIINSTGTISAKVAKLDSTYSVNESALNDLIGDKAEIEDLDIAKAATDLANAQNALQASYAVSSTILNSVSLLDYI